MEESVTYQAIIAKGREKGFAEAFAEAFQEGIAIGQLRETKKILLLLGWKRFGPSDPATIAFVESLTDLERIAQLAERVQEVSSWQELLR